MNMSLHEVKYKKMKQRNKTDRQIDITELQLQQYTIFGTKLFVDI